MTVPQYRHGFLIFAVLSFSVATWIMILHYIAPTEIVELVGVNNGYVAMFLVALFGGVSSFTGVSFIATTLTLSAGGLDPVLLALASGIGVSLSDTLFFFIGRHAHHVIESPRLQHLIERSAIWLNDRSRLVMGLCIYFYTAFTPLPTDILTMVLGITHQPYRHIIVPLTLGNITFTYLLAIFGGGFFAF